VQGVLAKAFDPERLEMEMLPMLSGERHVWRQ
jgi:hypothetical protein